MKILVPISVLGQFRFFRFRFLMYSLVPVQFHGVGSKWQRLPIHTPINNATVLKLESTLNFNVRLPKSKKHNMVHNFAI